MRSLSAQFSQALAAGADQVALQPIVVHIFEPVGQTVFAQDGDDVAQSARVLPHPGDIGYFHGKNLGKFEA